jgi:hypothetical protein
VEAAARAGFPLLSRHVLRAVAAPMSSVDEPMAAALTPTVLTAILDAVPDEWLRAASSSGDAAAARAAYRRYFTGRLAAPRPFLDDAADGR